MKSYRYKSLFFTLCFSVFMGHNLIPHNHHSEQVNVPISSECPVDHGGRHEHQHDNNHAPLHCHALIDVVCNKYNSIQIGKVNTHFHTLAIPSFLAILTPIPREISSVYFHFIIPDKLSEYFGARSLRAPPVVA